MERLSDVKLEELRAKRAYRCDGNLFYSTLDHDEVGLLFDEIDRLRIVAEELIDTVDELRAKEERQHNDNDDMGIRLASAQREMSHMRDHVSGVIKEEGEKRAAAEDKLRMQEEINSSLQGRYLNEMALVRRWVGLKLPGINGRLLPVWADTDAEGRVECRVCQQVGPKYWRSYGGRFPDDVPHSPDCLVGNSLK